MVKVTLWMLLRRRPQMQQCRLPLVYSVCCVGSTQGHMSCILSERDTFHLIDPSEPPAKRSAGFDPRVGAASAAGAAVGAVHPTIAGMAIPGGYSLAPPYPPGAAAYNAYPASAAPSLHSPPKPSTAPSSQYSPGAAYHAYATPAGQPPSVPLHSPPRTSTGSYRRPADHG